MGVIFKEYKESCISCKTPTNNLYCIKCTEEQKNRDRWNKIKREKTKENNERFHTRPKPPRIGEIRIFKAI